MPSFSISREVSGACRLLLLHYTVLQHLVTPYTVFVFRGMPYFFLAKRTQSVLISQHLIQSDRCSR